MKSEAFELMRTLEAEHWWYRARREILGTVLQRHLTPGSQVLDFGSGCGGNARHFRDLGYQVVCADRAPQALAACAEAGLETLDLRRSGTDETRVDGVTLFDVLEHVDEETPFLHGVTAGLIENGPLFVSVPAYELLWSGEDFVSEHERRYTRRSLRHALENAGLVVERVGYFNTWLLPAIGTVTLWRRLFDPRALYRSDVVPTAEPLNGLLHRIFRSERRIVSRCLLPVGASVLAVARKGAALATHDSAAATRAA